MFGAQYAALHLTNEDGERRMTCVLDDSWTAAKLPGCPK